MSRRVAVYALDDPRDNTTKYIGSSYWPQHRCREHIREAANGGPSCRCAWIRELMKNGLQPSVRVLVWGHNAEMRRTERELIDRTKMNGDALLNDVGTGERNGNRIDINFSVRFDNAIMDALDSACIENGRSRNYLIQEAVCTMMGMDFQAISKERKDKRNRKK